MEIHSDPHEWREYDHWEFKDSDHMYGSKSIFPLHGLPRLKLLDNNMKKRLKLHCSELHKM